MKNTKVVHLADVRRLLAELDAVRQGILNGNVSGWIGALRDESGAETVYVGGDYHRSPELRLAAVLKLSSARVALEDQPLKACS